MHLTIALIVLLLVGVGTHFISTWPFYAKVMEFVQQAVDLSALLALGLCVVLYPRWFVGE
jgi:hypothetical protein